MAGLFFKQIYFELSETSMEDLHNLLNVFANDA